jgi:hypothetical protein
MPGAFCSDFVTARKFLLHSAVSALQSPALISCTPAPSLYGLSSAFAPLRSLALQAKSHREERMLRSLNFLAPAGKRKFLFPHSLLPGFRSPAVSTWSGSSDPSQQRKPQKEDS